MADQKISAMASAGNCFNSDVFPLVRAGANFKCLRTDFFIPRTGEAITIGTGTGYLQIDSAGNVRFNVSAGADFRIDESGGGYLWMQDGGQIDFYAGSAAPFNVGTATTLIQQQSGFGMYLSVGPSEEFDVSCAGVSVFHVSSAGDVSIVGLSGQSLIVLCNSGFFNLDMNGGIQIVPAGGQLLLLHYDAANPGDWVAAPTQVNVAIDSLAAAVAGLLGGPIP